MGEILVKHVPILELMFDGAGATWDGWFNRDRLRKTPWNDLYYEEMNYFEIQHSDEGYREWFINRNYGGCGSDSGWLVVFSNDYDGCEWEINNRQAYGGILYAKTHH